MKPIWIVDDDESIRWVLEKALARENLAQTESLGKGNGIGSKRGSTRESS